MANQPRPEPEWWVYQGGPKSYSELSHAVHARLRRAAEKCGWANETAARAYLCEEPWAFVSRLSGGWAGVCEESSPEGLAWATNQVTEHLWEVRTGAKDSLSVGQMEAEEAHAGLAAIFTGRGIDEAPPAAKVPPEEQILTGRDLAMVLANLLHGDAAMTPVAGCRRLHVRLDYAVMITQELKNEWKESGHMDKSIFKRILTQRLSAQGTSPAPPTSGLTRPFARS